MPGQVQEPWQRAPPLPLCLLCQTEGRQSGGRMQTQRPGLLAECCLRAAAREREGVRKKGRAIIGQGMM